MRTGSWACARLQFPRVRLPAELCCVHGEVGQGAAMNVTSTSALHDDSMSHGYTHLPVCDPGVTLTAALFLTVRASTGNSPRCLVPEQL